MREKERERESLVWDLGIKLKTCTQKMERESGGGGGECV